MTELRPPPEHQDKPLHWVESCDSGPIVWEWCAGTWIIPGYSLPVLPRGPIAMPYRYLGPAEWRPGFEDGDRPDQWSAQIAAAHPMKTGDHHLYATAMEMVGNRHSKGALVELVNWLLHDAALSQAALSEAHTTAATQREVIATLHGRIERLRTLLQSELDQGMLNHRPISKMAIESALRETGTK